MSIVAHPAEAHHLAVRFRDIVAESHGYEITNACGIDPGAVPGRRVEFADDELGGERRQERGDRWARHLLAPVTRSSHRVSHGATRWFQ